MRFMVEESGITREDLDQCNVRSHNLAVQFLEEDLFKDEITPVTVSVNSREQVIDSDVSIRHGAGIDGMASLKPAFKVGA